MQSAAYGQWFSAFKTGLSFFALIFIFFFLSIPVSANPAGGQVMEGLATIQQQPGILTVHQASERAVINWQEFSINSSELTRFVQPSADAAILNRVTGAAPSLLDGTLEANGRVFLINPNGVVVGPQGRIDTAAFAASTLNVPDGSFMAGGDLLFSGDSDAAIRNFGVISAAQGDVLLIARKIENSGTLSAPEGTAGLAAGNKVLMTRAGDERLVIETGLTLPEAEKTGVVNSGLIQAGRAELISAGGNIYALAVNNGGTIHATGLVNEGGRVLLKSFGGTIENPGTITAREADGSGGNIRITAEGESASAVMNSGKLDVSGITAKTTGGTVTITADTILLENGTHIDAGGESGGGFVRVGGDYQGANPEVYNAQETSVENDVTISADAFTEGNGGTVIVWADGATSFEGAISARGGDLSGNGGFVEVSGKQSLNYQGLTDTRAPAGEWGTLLLDPTEIHIGDIYTTGTVGSIDYYHPNTISSNLSMGNVTLLADNSLFFESGTIQWFTLSRLTLDAPLVALWDLSTIAGTSGALTISSGNVQQDAGATIDVDTLRLYQTGVAAGSFSLLGRVSAKELIAETADLTGSGNYLNAFSEITINNQNNTIDSITFLREEPAFFLAPSWAKFLDLDIYTQGDLLIDCQQEYAAFVPGGPSLPLLRFANPAVLRAGGNVILSAGTRLPMDIGQNGLALVAGGNFINNSDGNVLMATDGISKFNIYATDPRNDTLGGLSGYRYYNTSFNPASPTLGVTAAFAYTLAPTLTLRVNDTDMEYGGFYPNFTVDFQGLITGDTRNYGTSFDFDTAATASSPVGDYPVAIAAMNGPPLADAEGYTLVYAPGTFTIDPAPLTIQPDDFTRLYGEENPTIFTVTYTGFRLGDDENVVTGLSVDTGAVQASDAGSYPIVATGAQADNYTITPIDGTLTVNPAPLTIRANDAVRRIGDPDPAFTVSCQGLMAWDQDAGGNAKAGVFDNLWFNVEGSPGPDAPPGIYLIMPAGDSRNYDVSVSSDYGALIIKEPYQLIIIPDDKHRLYGEVNPLLTASFEGFEDGDNASVVSGLLLATTASDRSDTGTYPITVSNWTVPAYYTVILRQGLMTVNPAPLHITALDAQVTYGSSLPAFTAMVTGLLPGDSLDAPYDFLVPSGRLDTGTHPIGIFGGTAGNYEVFRHDGTLTVNPAPLTVRADDTQMIEGQPYPQFTATATGLMYDDTIDVVSGLDLVPVNEITQTDGTGIPVTHLPPAENMMFINQSGTLTALNYEPISFQPGLLTITEPQPEVITIEITDFVTVTDDTDGVGGGGGLHIDLTPPPFGVPPEGQGFITYAARLFIQKMGLDVSDISQWLTDPANRALILGQLIDLLKAPINEGTALYNQREIFKTCLENQIREMQIAIAKDAVERYNAWKAEQQQDSNRLLGLLGGTLETPPEDFAQTAAVEYISSAISITALGTVFGSMAAMMATSTVTTVGVIGSAILAEGTSAFAAYGANLTALGITTSTVGTIAAPVSGALFAIAGTVVRAIQLSAYDKVEDKYANLVSDAQNFDIDTLINGDTVDLGQLFDFMFISAMQ